MVAAEESRNYQQFSAKPKNPSDSSRMALQFDQNYSLSCLPPATLTASVAAPFNAPDLRGLNICQQNTDGRFSELLPSYWDISYPDGNPYLKTDYASGLGVANAKPIDTSGASQRRFLIFDQSGNHTRLFVSPFSPQNQIIGSKTDAVANCPFENLVPLVDQELSPNPIVDERWDENHLSDGEDEMLEDTEEINALLYSDSDDEYDEVTSTRCTPFSTEEEGPYGKDNLVEEIIEEVASSDDGSPKRQRLLDGRYKKSSLARDESPVKRASTCSYEDDVESSCPGGSDLSKREKKVKVRDALKILESIIPGLKTNDPLSVIDHAIVYLKSMKIEAEALGLGCPELQPASFP